MNELTVLQAIRLKGRVSPADVATTLDETPGAWPRPSSTDRRWSPHRGHDRISPDGRDRLTALLAEERAGINSAAITAAYDDFRAVNADFKAWPRTGSLKTASPTHTTTPTTTPRYWTDSTVSTSWSWRSSRRPPRRYRG